MTTRGPPKGASNMVTEVMLVDDHQLMRDVLVHVLSREEDLDVVAPPHVCWGLHGRV